MAMMSLPFRERGLIVSCQALPDEPLYGAGVMGMMAKAAEMAGAVGIRTNGADDVRLIKSCIGLPVIGLNKRVIAGSEVFITPELADVEAIVSAGAEIVALDMTDRENRYDKLPGLVKYIHDAGAFVMADVSTLEEGIRAEAVGADLISSTLSGYTPFSPQQETPDFELVRQLSRSVRVPVVAEGRIWTPEEAVTALECGATYVVVGSAITRPQLIAARYAEKMGAWLNGTAGIAARNRP
ncbi:MAG: N-acetylmannosamine-6-phosphate 2-epimerase [Paenibacillaceae bacterium]|nr:N-acetylmannosamine-6-phosphate 2-epimerase [Paenibacillaceae bacterium]